MLILFYIGIILIYHEYYNTFLILFLLINIFLEKPALACPCHNCCNGLLLFVHEQCCLLRCCNFWHNDVPEGLSKCCLDILPASDDARAEAAHLKLRGRMMSEVIIEQPKKSIIATSSFTTPKDKDLI